MNKQNKIIITKASGDQANFSEKKLRNSLERSGAKAEQIQEVINEISNKLYQGISTKKIYRMAFNVLRRSSKPVAAKYNLKRAIMELGPSGFPFEKFIGEILRYQGYSIKVGEIVMGKCVNHEVDVTAEKGEHHFMVECKYHNHPGTVCDVKIPLYVQARFKDVEAAWLKLPGHGAKFHQGWVVTNTRFTSDAIQYGNCAGMKLMGWNYPDGTSLRSQIDTLGLYPVTCLTSLSKSEKQLLLQNKIVLTKELCYDENILIKAGIQFSRIKAIMQEATELCRGLNEKK